MICKNCGYQYNSLEFGVAGELRLADKNFYDKDFYTLKGLKLESSDGTEVDFEAKVCPKCNSILLNIKDN